METSLKLVSGAARQAVRSEHADAIRSLRKRAASDIIEIGNRLIDVKENHCAHGEWLPWLEAEFGWSESTALRFMRVAEMAAKSVTVTDLDIPIGSLYQLAAPSTPEPVRQAAFEAIANGEKVTPSDIREMVRIAKPILEDEEPQRGGSDHNHRAQGTGENEWYTPAQYIEAARELLGGFDLDPATSDAAQARVKAANWFTKEDDGLAQEWRGKVWLNPPYAQPLIQQFVDKLVEEVEAGNVTEAILLTHNYTDTGWFHAAERAAANICFTRGRIRFEGGDGSFAAPTQGQAFFYFGNRGGAFRQAFERWGFVR
jgi:phage N-6-adenine-methyltransferase